VKETKKYSYEYILSKKQSKSFWSFVINTAWTKLYNAEVVLKCVSSKGYHEDFRSRLTREMLATILLGLLSSRLLYKNLKD